MALFLSGACAEAAGGNANIFGWRRVGEFGPGWGVV